MRIKRRWTALLAGLVLAGALVGAQPMTGTAAEQGGDWVVRDTGTEADLLDVAANDTIIVAVGAGGTILTSTDGVLWVKREAGVTLDLDQILWGNGRFVALAKERYAPRAVLSSVDGLHWEVTPLQETLSDGDLRFDADRFTLGVVEDLPYDQHPLCFTSADGKVWSPAPVHGPEPPRVAGREGNTLIGYVGEQIYTSTDGRTWSKAGRTSLPGIWDEWQPGLAGLIYGNGTYAAWYFLGGKGGYSSYLVGSKGGAHWQGEWSQGVFELSLAFGNDQFVVATEGGYTAVSRNGEDWIEQPSGVTADLKNVIHAQGHFVAVGEKGTLISRRDLWPWPDRAQEPSYKAESTHSTYRLDKSLQMTMNVTSVEDGTPAPDGTQVTLAAYQAETPLRLAEYPVSPQMALRGTGLTRDGVATIELGVNANENFVVYEEPNNIYAFSVTEDWFSPLTLKEDLPESLPAGPSVLPDIPIQPVDASRPGGTQRLAGPMEGMKLTMLLQGNAWFVDEYGNPRSERGQTITDGKLPGVAIVAQPGAARLSIWDQAGRIVGGYAYLTEPTTTGSPQFFCRDDCTGYVVIFDAPCAPFTDVLWTDLACPALQQMADLKVTAGYADGTFRPAQQVTRAEFAKLLLLTLKRPPEPNGALRFTDTAGHWAASQGYLQAAVSGGMIQGFADGTFRPESPVSRAEAVKMVAAAAGWKPAEGEELASGLSYWDVAPTDWYAGWLATADDQRLIGRWPYPHELWEPNGFDGFEGARPVTRLEAITLLANLWEHLKH